MMKSKLWIALVICTLVAMGSAQTSLNGAGATFPNPIYQKWFNEYHNAHSDVQINYQSIGSGGGIQQLTAGTVDFGASDGPMTDEQLSKIQGKVLHIPTVLGAVVPTYNIPGVSVELKFTGDVLADIFMGKITKWNDGRLAKANPGVKFPDLDIVVVHRGESSGTTYIFTDYLSKVSPEWASTVKKGTAVNWPVGLGQKGNEAVAGTVKQTEGSIGYVELIYALSNKNAPGKEAYPISSFTWLLVPAEWNDAGKCKAFTDFLNWMVDKGQTMTTALEYAPLPTNVATKVKARIKEVKAVKKQAQK